MSNERDFRLIVENTMPGARLIGSGLLAGGISSGMYLLEVEWPGRPPEKFVLRIPAPDALLQNPNAARDEFRLLSQLRAQGLPTPIPTHLDETCTILRSPFLLVRYMPGKSELIVEDLHDRIEKYANALTLIHRSQTDGLEFLPRVSERLPFWIDKLARQTECEALHVVERLKSEWPWPQINRSVLIHGDFWPGNVLWSDGRITAIIDWEEALIGDPLADLAITRLDMLWAFGAGAMADFTRAYLSAAQVDTTSLPYWDLCAFLRPDGHFDDWATPWAGIGRTDITGDTMRKACLWFADRALANLQSAVPSA